MDCSNGCAICWTGCIFRCSQPCAVLEDDEKRGPLVPNDNNNNQGFQPEGGVGKGYSGVGLYIQVVGNAFKEYFEDDEDLRTVWRSLSQVEIVKAVYYMARYRASRLERGLVAPPEPIDGGFTMRTFSSKPLGPDDFRDWMFFAEAAYQKNERQLREHLSKRDHQLVSFSSPMQLFEPAYFMSMSTKDDEKLLVVGVKGTSSALDWLTTFWIEKEELNIRVPEDADDRRDFGVHGGMVHAARYLLDRIGVIIKRGFYDAGFKVVFVGHSLGAAVATVCAVILREEDKMDRVFACGIAPPPVMSLVLAQQSSAYIISLINNDDVIPRTSLKQIKTLIANIRKTVDTKNRLGGHWSRLEQSWEESDWRQLEQEFAGEWKEGRFDTYVPGRILFMYSLGRAQLGHVEVACDADTLRIAVLSSRMLSNHLLESYQAALDPPYFYM